LSRAEPRVDGLRTGPAIGLAVLSAAVFGLTFLYWWKYPEHQHIDVRAHLPWTYRWHDPGLFPNDLMTDYFQRYHLTPGLKAVYFVLVELAGVPLTVASRVVAVGCFVATFLLLVAVVRRDRPAGPWTATIAGVAVGLLPLVWPRANSIDPFYWLDGGLSRAPAASALLLMIYGLARPSMVAVNLAIVLAALSYPPALVLVVTTAGIVGVTRPPREAVRFAIRLAPGAVAAALVVAAWNPLGVDEKFGPLLTRADFDRFPEIVTHHFSTGTGFTAAVLVQWLTGNAATLAALAVLAALGGISRYWRAAAALIGAGLVTTIVVYFLWPALYDVNRYIQWPPRVVFVPTVAAIAAQLLERLETRQNPTGTAPSRSLISNLVFVACVIAIVLAGGYRFTRFPVPARTPPAILRFIATTPIDTLVAAYPGDGDAVPLDTKRALLVHPVALFPYHSILHRQAIERFRATRDAVYATDWAAVRRLRDEIGVRYLIVNRARFRPDHYDALLAGHVCLRHLPGETADLLARGPNQPFVLRAPPTAAVAMEDGDFVVLDLDRLP
jgi:hypothetical protein